MRGVDLTEWQLKAAEKFLRDQGAVGVVAEILNERMIIMPFGDFVRVVAWYGQIRAKAVECGAPADEPGETYTVPQEIVDGGQGPGEV